jgi:hypothetical protein
VIDPGVQNAIKMKNFPQRRKLIENFALTTEVKEMVFLKIFFKKK